MTNRSASPSIKGYFYQFDQTIVRLLEAVSPEFSIVVEGIEDIDIDDGDVSTFVQCKYYEASEYNHSLIKEAVMYMLTHFQAAGCPSDQKCRYRVFGHYKAGHQKLPQKMDLNFVKKNFLTHKKKNKIEEIHKVLDVSDQEISLFIKVLDIDITGPSYEDQQKLILKLMIAKIPGCKPDDAETFFYPNAIEFIRRLAVESNVSKRRTTKAAFVREVSRKEVILGIWLRQKFGEDFYAQLIKRKYFKFNSTNIPKASRIFAIDLAEEFDLARVVPLLDKIGRRLSHTEHKRTPPPDRFCPYILLRGIQPQDLIRLKGELLHQGMRFADGYPYNGSGFHPALLATPPTKENLIQLKFIPCEAQLTPVVNALSGSLVSIFDFFKTSPLGNNHIPPGFQYHPVKVESAYFINEVL